MMTKKALLKIKGLSETKVDKIKEAAIKSQVTSVACMPWQMMLTKAPS